MAIWQYVAYLVPAASIGPEGTLPGIVARGDCFELPRFVFPFSPAEFARLADDYLPPAQSWSEKVRVWGDGTRDDLKMVAEGGQVIDVRVRLDLSDLTINRIRKLLRLAQALRCGFVEGRTRAVFPATEDQLVNSIRTSRPAAFVADPHGFLERLARDTATRPPE